MEGINYQSGANWDFLVLDADQLLISQVIEQRNIRWLCHFTPRANLEKIKQNGLKTRDLLFDWETTVTDPSRFDRFQNAICLSISKPNSWMFNRKQEQGLDLCLLLISPEVLFKKNCLFYPHNAATASYRNINIETLKGEKGLENMFSNPISYQKSGMPPQDIFRFHYLLPCETTSEQAEVQCLENIESQYIQHIFEYDIPLTYDEIKFQVDGHKSIYAPTFEQFEKLLSEEPNKLEEVHFKENKVYKGIRGKYRYLPFVDEKKLSDGENDTKKRSIKELLATSTPQTSLFESITENKNINYGLIDLNKSLKSSLRSWLKARENTTKIFKQSILSASELLVIEEKTTQTFNNSGLKTVADEKTKRRELFTLLLRYELNENLKQDLLNTSIKAKVSSSVNDETSWKEQFLGVENELKESWLNAREKTTKAYQQSILDIKDIVDIEDEVEMIYDTSDLRAVTDEKEKTRQLLHRYEYKENLKQELLKSREKCKKTFEESLLSPEELQEIENIVEQAFEERSGNSLSDNSIGKNSKVSISSSKIEKNRSRYICLVLFILLILLVVFIL